jgi:hypothetical protein
MDVQFTDGAFRPSNTNALVQPTRKVSGAGYEGLDTLEMV